MLIRLADGLIRRAKSIIFITACLAGVATCLTAGERPIEGFIEEVRNEILSKAVSGETVIVEINGRSLAEVHSWPFPRSLHGQIIDRLRKAGARTIVFDIAFSSPSSDVEQDNAFAAAISRASDQVVIPAVIEFADDLGAQNERLPTDKLRRHARIGSIWIYLDKDMYARRLPYSVGIAGAQRPSLAAFLADRPSERRGFFPIDWSYDWTSFHRVNYADVLAGRFGEDVFRNRNVLIGVTSSTLGDRFTVPSHGRLPGLYVQAVGSETLRRGAPVPLGDWPALAATIGFMGLSLMLRKAASRLAGLAVAIALLVGVYALLRELTPSILGIEAALVTLFTAILLQSAAGIASSVMSRLTQDPGSNLPNITAMRLSAPTPGITVAVRLRNSVETAALLGADVQRELLRKVSARLSLAASGAAVFQVDDHSFAWRAEGSFDATIESIEGLHAILASGVTVGGCTVDVTVSIGVCEESDLDTDAAVTAALLAAERAAQRGLNWEKYVADDDGSWRLSLLGDLDRAIDHGEVWVAYQPKFDLATRTLMGAEALARWSHPERGDIRPDLFIPIVEENGRIEKLTLHVLHQAIRDFSDLDENLSVAVNISMRMIGRNRLVEPIRAMLERYHMDAQRLTLEITESAAPAGEAGIQELNRLRELGVHISIDDYGTGQSTLSYLKTLPATELKIDRSFVQLIRSSKSDATVVDSTIKLAHALGLRVVAEGVDSEETLALLEAMDCDIIQGFHIGEPTPLHAFLARLPKLSHRAASAR